MLPHTVGPRRLVLAGIVAALALLAGSAGLVQFRADASWSAMQAETARLRAAWDARPRAREVLWGEATGDAAFGHYDRATALAKELQRQDHTELVATLRDTDAQVAERRSTLRARWRPVVDALRAGAHATDVRPTHSPIDPPATIANLLDCRWVANAAVFEARALRHQGRGVDAVQHTLDVATFGTDLLRDGLLINQMIGLAILAIGTGDAWPNAALAALERPALDLLAEGLARLDRGLPPTLDQQAELLFYAHWAQQVPPDPTYVPTTRSWRYGFSSRWMLGEAFTLAARTARDLERARELPWPQRQALLELEYGALADSGNPVLALMTPNLVSAETNLRQTLAVVRLLRMAVDLHRGLDLPPLRDPLGDGPIVVRRSDDGVQLRCEGADARKHLARTVRRR